MKTVTPVGAGALAAALVNIALGLLNGWSWYAHQTTTVQSSVATVLTFGAVYLAGWFSVTRQPGQKANLELTPGPLPTVKLEQPPAKM